MRKLLSLSVLSLFISAGIVLFAQSDTPAPQSAGESLEAELPEPQPEAEESDVTVEAGGGETEGGAGETQEGAPLELKEGPYTFEILPQSLDSYYPPVGKRARVYPAYMDTLGRRFYDLLVDLKSLHLDRDAAEVSYFAFKDYYEFVAELVPEWKDRFLLSDVEALGRELGFIKDTTDTTQTAEGEKGEKPIGETERVSERALYLVRKIEYSCRVCHLTEIPRVYARYYWRTKDNKFSVAHFMVRDPIKKRKMKYREFKRLLQEDYYTILRSIDKGSRKQLRESVRRFIKRFNYNQSLCSKCHTMDPYLFTTPTIAELVSDLDKEAHKRVPSKGVLRKTLSSLYVQNCKACHRAHLPLTYVQRWWYGEFDIPPEAPQVEESAPVLSEPTDDEPPLEEQPPGEQPVEGEQPQEGGAQ